MFSFVAGLWPLLLLAGTLRGPPPTAAYCLPQRFLVLAGIRLDTPEDSVSRLLGPALRRSNSRSRDDGGEYDIVTLHYQEMEVELDRGGRVAVLRTTSRRAAMAGGVRVGQTMEEVTGRLRTPPDLEELEEITWAPPICDDGPLVAAGGTGATLTWTSAPGLFDVNRPWSQKRSLARIELYHGRP
jgi:hypothetical protein